MKSLKTAYLLWLASFMGFCGLHRFYLGKPVSGVVFLITGGLFGIGTLFDAFAMTSLVQQARYREGIAGRVTLDELFSDAQVRPVAGSQHKKQSIEQVILLTAKNGNGFVSPSEVALEGGVAIETARQALDALVEKGFCELKVRQTGALVYFFPDFEDDPDGAKYQGVL